MYHLRPLPLRGWGFVRSYIAVRLQSIKLSGFKSFAEPTNFMLPGQLVGVVGPNGCGKSNIMDAVRWVLGESKASELRGESMQDVIFNGTTQRKPASRASVELNFDNSDHRAGGQWNQFTEIAVKRVLTRDGGSNYFINNQPVRRRDVQDVFLGTGLGPRAYAIIGQGTISRIIESRPEELRLFLEEAAGVSKYKERRRETQNRLHDTQENLTRVEDILRELASNLEKLEKQAEVAAQYHALHASATLKQHQLWFLKKQDAESDLAEIRAQGLEAVNALEEGMAQLRHIEADMETQRQAHYAAGDAVNQSQGRLYEATAEVARLEAEIRYVVEGRQRVAQRLLQLQEQMQQWQQRQEDAAIELEELAASGMDVQEQAELLAAQVEEQAQRLPDLEDALRRAQQQANSQRQQVVQVQQQIHILAAEQRSLQEQMRQRQSRLERLRAERSQLATPDTAALAELEQQYQDAAAEAEMAEAALQELQDSLPALEDARRSAQQALNEAQGHYTDIAARQQALKALQEQLKVDEKLQPWLQRHGLDGLQGLWTRMAVEPGWENAVEAALRERMGALQVGRLDMVRGFLGANGSDAPPTRLAFYSTATAHSAPAPRGNALVDKIQVADDGLRAVLADWLQGCHTAANLDEALAQRGQLAEGASIYVASGHRVTAHSVAFYAQDSEQAGLLARAQEIEQLGKALRAQQLLVEEAQTQLARADAAWGQASAHIVSARRQAQETRQSAHELQVQWLRLQQQAEQASSRSAQLDAEVAEERALEQDLAERTAEAEARFEELDALLADAQERHAQEEDAVILAQQRLDASREQLRSLERQAQEAQFGERSVQARQAELQRTLETAEQQGRALRDEYARAQSESERLNDAAAQGGLQDALDVKMQREQELAQCRSHYDGLTQQLRASDELRGQIQRNLEPMRQRITEFQLREQAASLGSSQYTEQLEEAGADLAAVAQSIVEGNVRLHGLQAEIERLHREIAALGPVNLAALQELELATQRKTFLDAQVQDLTEAMHTLQGAIEKIDAQTRALLSDTFHTVNDHFGRMFPELFGGGQARLIMTGEEILDAGVQVMAQPPGKKNQTIHLLSGGEKALTAIALVFAIFQLNPAPFCLLDEVDAPLDDANTERYAKLVARMSSGTQFLFISHNKIAMEMAEQLIGVTMQEQGVSRIVAVDMESALTMAHPG